MKKPYRLQVKEERAEQQSRIRDRLEIQRKNYERFGNDDVTNNDELFVAIYDALTSAGFDLFDDDIKRYESIKQRIQLDGKKAHEAAK